VFRRFSTRIARAVAREDGFALIVALGFTIVLTITATSAMAYAQQNQSTANYSKADQLALSYAEAALARAFSTVYAAPDPRAAGAVPSTTVTFEKGTGTYVGTFANGKWTLTGTGRVPSPNHAADVVRTVRGRVAVGTGSKGSANNAVWNYIYVDDTSACTTIGNSVSINIPLYVKGNLCLQNSANLTYEAYALQVGGYLQFENSSTVGNGGTHVDENGNVVSNRLREAHIRGGCRVGTSGPFASPCGDATRVFSATPPDANPQNLTKPPVDLAYWYANSMPGPRQSCTEGSFPGGFDTDGVMNKSRGNIDLAPSVDYSCKVRDASGKLIGEITWNHTTEKLTILGTIFFDGNLVFRNSTRITYEGKATIYTSGQITMSNSTVVCGVSTCDEDWKPLVNLLAFVAGESTAAASFTVGNFTRYQGAIYAVNDYVESNNSEIWGPIVARKVFLQNSARNFYVPIGTLLPGMPASYEEVVTLSNDPVGWG
jgi:Tfp pilus assembly protein PilX